MTETPKNTRAPQKEFVKVLQYGLWGMLCGFCALAAWLFIEQARAESSYEAGHLLLARRLNPQKAAYAKALGDQCFFDDPSRPEAAEPEYRAALALEPYEALHWLDWGRTCLRLGRAAQADKALRMAADLDPHNRTIQLQLGNIYLQEGRLDKAIDFHARAIALNPAIARDIYTHYWKLGLSPLTLARDLSGDNHALLRSYFGDALGWVDPATAQSLWPLLQRHSGLPEAELCQQYFSFLVARQDFTSARRLWRKIAREYYQRDWDEQAEILWNGDFGRPLKFPGGLEWQIGRQLPRGVQSCFVNDKGVAGGKTIALYFDGRDNVSFSHVRHFFFVEPGRTYRLQCQARTDEITTDNGVYVLVRLYGSKPVSQKSEVLTGTGLRELMVEFSVPEGCEWAELVIARDRSSKLNNRIKGDAEFSGFKVTRL